MKRIHLIGFKNGRKDPLDDQECAGKITLLLSTTGKDLLWNRRSLCVEIMWFLPIDCTSLRVESTSFQSLSLSLFLPLSRLCRQQESSSSLRPVNTHQQHIGPRCANHRVQISSSKSSRYIIGLVKSLVINQSENINTKDTASANSNRPLGPGSKYQLLSSSCQSADKVSTAVAD